MEWNKRLLMKRRSLVKMTLLVCLGQLAPVHGAAPTFNWIATGSGNDLNVGSNWNPSGPPVAGDVANFNSTLTGIDLNPVATTPFTTGEMNFLQGASPFNFTFTNTSLNFAGLDMVGITGMQRDPTITLTNTNTVVIPQLKFTGNVSDSFGSAQITVSNNLTNTGGLVSSVYQVFSTAPYALFDSGAKLSIEDTFVATQNSIIYELDGQGKFNTIEALDNVTITITSNGSCGDNTHSDIYDLSSQLFTNFFRAHDFLNLTVTNTGESGVNSSNNISGAVISEQIETVREFSIGNDGTITVSNSGTNSGTDSLGINNVGVVGYTTFSPQFGSTSSSVVFTSGDRLNLNISNMGMNTASASGGHVVGNVTSDQMAVYSFTTGDNSQLTFTNTGINEGTNAHNSFIGYVNAVGGRAQFNVSTTSFLAGDNLKLVVTNSGTDASNGAGFNFVGGAGGQAYFNTIFSTGDNAIIQLSNSGNANGSTGAPIVGIGIITNNGQFLVGSEFIAGDGLNFSVSNYGQNNDAGGTLAVGSLNFGSQVNISNCSVGDNASFTLTNTGINTQGSNNSVGFVSADQFLSSTFIGKDHFTLTATNSGSDSSLSATTRNEVGFVGTAQFSSSGPFYVQDNATFILTNSGTNTGDASNSFIGNVLNMMNPTAGFFARDGLNITLTNTGNSSGIGNNNKVGVATNNLFFSNGIFTAGDNATITLNNTGTLTEGSTYTVATSTSMFAVNNTFFVGDDFTLTATNSGTNTSPGITNKVADFTQMVSLSNTILGKDATINVSNFGSYSGTDTNTSVGLLTNQFRCNGPFTAGDNLTLVATNAAVNPNSLNVGKISGDQIVFNSIVALNDGALIKAVNSGTVLGNLIHFAGNDLNVLGKATFEAINTGTLTANNGILVSQSAGGDIAIVLQDCTLRVNNTNAPIPFMMGSLTGDINSTATAVNSNTGFIINTDAGVNATFLGTMNAFNLTKDGPGTQNLGGTTYVASPGLVNEGILNVTGTYNGNLLTRGLGTLSGSGTVNGTVYDSGIVLPNRTLTVTNFETSGSGILQSNVTAQNGSGLLAVTNNTTLNGGQVLVGTFDGTYLFYHPYTILTSVNPISGTFDSIATVSPLINPVITYLSNSIQVTLKQNISAAAFNHNQRVVAAVLDATMNPTLAQSLLLSQLVDLTIPQASDALDTLAGVQYANETFYNETINRQFIRRLYDPIRFIVACSPCYDPCGNNLTAWLEGGGDFTTLNRDSMNGYHVTGGAHMRFNESFLLGVGVSYEGDWIHYDHHRGRQTKQTALGGLYGLFRDDYFYILADLAYGYTQGDLKREIHIHSFSTKSHPHHSQGTFYGELGLDMLLCDIALQPFAGVEVNSYWRNALRESNESGWGLLVHKRNRTATYSRLGLHLTLCETLPFRASLDAAWDYRCTQLDNRTLNELLSFTGDFDIIGERLARSSFDYALIIEKDITSSFNIYIEGMGQVYNRANTVSVLAGLSYSW